MLAGIADQRGAILDAVMQNVPEGITIAFGRDAVIHSVSKYGLSLTERDSATVTGIPADKHPDAWEVYRLDGTTPVRADDLPLTRACRGETVIGEELTVRTASGRIVPIVCNAGPILGTQGEVLGGIIAWRDNTDAHKAQQDRLELLAREAAARQAAEEANTSKDAFLARVAHELRTPLGAIAGWARVARKARGDTAMVDRAFQAIENNVRLQATIVEDLMDFSRVLSGRLELKLSDVAVENLIHESIDSVRHQLEARKQTVKLTSHCGANTVIRCDRVRMQQAICNLLTNASKFSDPQSTIEILCTVGDVDADIEVVDKGRGLTREQLEHVFEPFWQGLPSEHHDKRGLGLGLAIVRHIVRLHGGKVGANSDGPGLGSRFRLTLPARQRQV
jgi:signal transduction histidine kinase